MSDEAALVERVREADDHAAFGHLVRRHQGAVRQFLRRLTGAEAASADDLAQETFWRAYRKIGGFRGEGSFRSWLFSIAYQLYLGERRRRRRRPLEEVLEAQAEATGATTDGGTRAIEQTRTVNALLLTLRREERAAILLHYQHDLRHDEVARSLGLPLGTVKSLIRRGREKMRRGHEPGPSDTRPSPSRREP